MTNDIAFPETAAIPTDLVEARQVQDSVSYDSQMVTKIAFCASENYSKGN